MFKFGKTPARTDSVKLKFAEVFNAPTIPTPPASFGHELLLRGGNWGVLSNNIWGDCLVEGTVVSGFDVKGAYKAPYHGPIVTITTTSGKKLSVTPNHAVFTTKGFVCAKTIQKGDNLVGARGAQILPRPAIFGNKGNFDYPPTSIEQVFTSPSFSVGIPRKVVPRAVDFHGDGKFFNGNVDIVGTDSLLRSNFNSFLYEPNTQHKVSSAGHLKSQFISAGSFLLSNLASFFSTQSYIGFDGNGLSLCQRHTGIPQSKRLRLRSESYTRGNNFFFEMASGQPKLSTNFFKSAPSHIHGNGRTHIPMVPSTGKDPHFSVGSPLVAESVHPTIESGGTDTKLFSDFENAFSGLIEADCVINVDIQWNCRTHVYDLSTAPQWYLANGLVVHNCVWAGAAHEHMLWTLEGGEQSALFTSADVLSDYSAVTGFDPNKPATDQGTDMQAAAAYRQKTGIIDNSGVRHKIDAYSALKAGDLTELSLATWLFGAVGVGVECPSSMEEQFNEGGPWSVISNDRIVGGHYIPCVGKNSQGNYLFITWGRLQAATPEWVTKYMDEGLAYLSLETINASSKISPEGFNLDALSSYLKGIT